MGNSLYDPAAIGQTYETLGPQRLTQAELINYMYALTTRNKKDGTHNITELMLDPATSTAWTGWRETASLTFLRVTQTCQTWVSNFTHLRTKWVGRLHPGTCTPTTSMKGVMKSPW